MKDETQVKDEIILVVKEAIRDNTTLAAVDWEPAELDSDDVDNIAEEIADKLCPLVAEAEKQERKAEIAERALEYAVDDLNYCCDDCPCGVCTAEIRGSQECLDCIANVFKKYAEREIKEERK